MTPSTPLRITVWNEGVHEKVQPELLEYYPAGIDGAIAEGLRQNLPADACLSTARLDDPEHGLSQQKLDETDVLLWWGHVAHDRVEDAIVDRVHKRVMEGMGLVVLHSGHFSKIFIKLMGTTCSLAWRSDEGGERELVWNVNPSHPIAAGIDGPVVIDSQEMYGEYFDIPKPDDLVFISSFAGGEVFRSGVTFTRGKGKIFYFSPGDQDFPVYNHPTIRRILSNAVQWARPAASAGSAPAVTNPPREWFAS
jgi:trehalose utilization protein